MKRRDFVSMLIGATTAAIIIPKRVFSLPLPVVPQDFDTANLRYKAYERYSNLMSGFGMAPIKAEGSMIEYDPPVLDLNKASLEDLWIEVADNGRAELRRNYGPLNR